MTLIGTSGSGGPASADAAIIQHAIRAMSLAGERHRSRQGDRSAKDGTPVAVEWWQQTSPPYALRLIKGFDGRQSEGANRRNDVVLGTTRARTRSTSVRIRLHRRLIDPLSTVREQLASGSSQVAGTVTIDGLSLYKIELPNGVVGYFDRTDYRPEYVDNPQHDGSIVRTRVVTYEELPITPENEQLLSITEQHPRASVETSPTKAPGK